MPIFGFTRTRRRAAGATEADLPVRLDFARVATSLLLAIEKRIQAKDQENAMKNDRRSFLSFSVWTLINTQPATSLSALKCYVFAFLNDSDEIFKAFITTLQHFESKEMVPNAENSLFAQNAATNFVRPLSLLGFFVRTYEAEYDAMGTNDHFNQRHLWMEYLRTPPTEKELDRLSAQWKLDLREVMKRAEEAEIEIRHENRPRPPPKRKLPPETIVEFF
ncbi:hypothetical protein M3Y99_00777200 [Aphelenchoides fujianensis]|nr:hypothetical protein M3Y99_00777200 [Aphelenchoides fujianensis]